jgi:DNA-binding NarL/FixJ family response regulator
LARLIRLTDDIVMIGEASGSEAIIELIDKDPDVVVIDLVVGAERVELTRTIVDRNPSVGVVVITDPEATEATDEVFRAGARGLVARTTQGEQLLQALRMVAEGNVVIDAATWEASRALESEVLPSGGMIHLTRRELEVLRLLTRGYSNRLIADELGVADETVKTHVNRVFRRLGVGNRTDAVAKALRTGLVK